MDPAVEAPSARFSAVGWSGVLLCLAILTIVLPWLVLASRTEDSLGAEALVAQTGLVVLVAIRLMFILVRQTRLLHTMFLLYVYVFLGLAALAQMAVGRVPSSNRALSSLFIAVPRPVTTNQALGTTAIVAVGFGVYEVVRALVSGRGSLRTEPTRQIAKQRVVPTAWLSLLLTAVYVVSVGPSLFVGARFDLERALATKYADAVGPVVTALGTVPIWISFIALMLLRGEERFRTVGARFLRVVVGAAAIFTVNPVSSPRYIVGTFYGALVVALLCSQDNRHLRKILVTASAAFIIVFPYSDLFRYSTSAEFHRLSMVQQFQGKLDYDSFGQIQTANEYADRAGYAKGRQETGALLFFVPRSLWPTKPEDTGKLLAQYRGETFTNTSAPLWAESYVDFGLAGLIIVFAALAVISARLDNWLGRAVGAPRQLALLTVPLIGFYELIVLRGSLLAVMGRLLAIVLVARFLTGGTMKRVDAPVPAPAVPALRSVAGAAAR